MAIPALPSHWDLSPEPDLHPLYPSLTHISSLLSPNSGLAPGQRAELVGHCMARSCSFGELLILQYLLSDPHAQTYVDLAMRDEDGLGLVSLAIHGFGAESDRDVEREECVRLLIAQGADLGGDKGKRARCSCVPPSQKITDGWTPLHHAALLSPPTLVSHLMTHGCSPFAVTRRGLTPLDVVTAHSILPGRDDVALLLEESMRSEGWTGGKMEEKRRLSEQREKRKAQKKGVRNDISRILSIHPSWWGESDSDSESDYETEDDHDDEQFYVCALLKPTPLPDYSSMLVFSPPFLPHIFDSLITNYKPSLRDATPANTLYMLARGVAVFIIRFAERRIDELFDAAILDFSPEGNDFDTVQFESDWSFLRPFSGKKKHTSSAKTLPRARAPSSPPSPSPAQPFTPSQSQNSIPASPSKKFSSLRQTFNRPPTPLTSLFPDSPPTPTPTDLTSFLTALHTLLNWSCINPAMTTQLWSQVIYWTSCEIFNRIITRKKYLCRSRSTQISMNLIVLEEWIEQMELPPGVHSLSSIAEFPDLVEKIQTLKHINPLQMRRAIRDYKYEVNEGKMTEECVQYLTQLQKDWERHRVKLGVEALRKEMSEKEREGSVSSYIIESSGPSEKTPFTHIDNLFGQWEARQSWEPIKPSPTLGELLDSRYMLPLLFPSDPRMLAALPRTSGSWKNRNSGSAKRASKKAWGLRNKRLRDVGIGALQWVDGIRSTARWERPLTLNEEDGQQPLAYLPGTIPLEPPEEDDISIDTRATPLTRQPSCNTKLEFAAAFNVNTDNQPLLAIPFSVTSSHTSMILPDRDEKSQPPEYHRNSLYNPHSLPREGHASSKDGYDLSDSNTHPPFFHEPSNDDILTPPSHSDHSKAQSSYVDDSRASLVHNAATMGRAAHYEDLEYAEPTALADPSKEKKSLLSSFMAQGRYPIEQRIENKKRGIGRQKHPFVVWILTVVMLAVFIYELIVNSRAQGTPVSMKPVVNPMLGPSSSALINVGARFPPCMKLVASVPPSTNFGCLNNTANPPDQICSLETICGFGGFHDKDPNQWFRFIVPIFLHAGFIHILLNMLAQLSLSAQIEREMGSTGFLITYFAAGIFGNVLGGNFSLVGVPSVGASGAIFGTVARVPARFQQTLCAAGFKPAVSVGLAHMLDPSLPSAPANDGEKHSDYSLTVRNGSQILFFWDPFLNSTHTLNIVRSARDVGQRPALLVLGSGLWYLRYANSSGGLPSWEVQMEQILTEISKSPVWPADQTVVLPVEQVVPSKLTEDRALSMRLSDIDAMNADLQHRISTQTSNPFFPGSSKQLQWMKGVQNPALVFSIGVALIFLADRSSLWLKEHKQFNPWTFAFLCMIALFVGIATIKRSDKDLGFLNREQTDEWKGWMQLAILIYHYLGASKISGIYNPIRVLVASYLFMTGYGHTTYYIRKADYGFLRVAQVMVRLNFLTLVLAYTMNTDYISYYFSPLVSMWYLIIYATMFVGCQFNDRTPFLLGKIFFSAVLFTFFMKEEWLLETAFSILSHVCGIHWSAREWNFRVTLDLWIVYIGMLAAVAVIKIRDHRLTEHPYWPIAMKTSITVSALGLMWFFAFELLQESKFTYNYWHPYISWVPVVGFVVLRNASVVLRSASSSAFAFIGRCSLETFIIQYHLWLAGDTKGVLLVIPGTSWRPLNFVLTTIMFVYVSDQMAHATTAITSWICNGTTKPASLPLPATSSGTNATSSLTNQDSATARTNENTDADIPLASAEAHKNGVQDDSQPITPVRSRRWVDRLTDGAAAQPQAPGFRIWYGAGEGEGWGLRVKILTSVGVMWAVNLLWSY
ncbi:hypothetical protein H0H93_015209 [Arthromyces matolae]|nr:hypothetical protein H0H93_015209 [Arthromyces matolae]